MPKPKTTNTYNTMKRFIATAALLIAAAPAQADWAERGDDYVKQGNYAAAYAAYMSRCDDPSGSHNMRMASCQDWARSAHQSQALWHRHFFLVINDQTHSQRQHLHPCTSLQNRRCQS